MKFICLLFIAVIITGSASGCKRRVNATEAQIKALEADCQPAMRHLDQVMSYDSKTQAYVQRCLDCPDLEGEAKVSPILYEATYKKILSPAQAIEVYKKFIAKHPDNADYFNACIKHMKWEESEQENKGTTPPGVK